jgi:hypothetical protein
VSGIGQGDVRAAIAVAAQRTGVDFDYLLGQARLESSLDPSAQAGTSSAAGLYQFTGSTWLATLDRHGAEHGLGWAGAAIEGGRVDDPALRAQIMAMRFDPQVSALMAAELANDNKAALTGALGRTPDSAELYLAHFLGAEGAATFLTALAADPGQSAAAINPRAAAANRAIFYDEAGAPRSLGGVMDLLRGRLDAAMGGAGFLSPSGEGIETWGLSANSAWTASTHPDPSPERPGHSALPQAPSMADTLRDAFALGDRSAAPAHVQAAYGALRRFGL